MWLIARIDPLPVITFRWREGFALASTTAGALVALLGVLAFRRAQTTVDPRAPESASTVVASGVYRFSRNPMYLGFLLLLASVGLWIGSPVALVVVPAYVLYMNRFQIGPEERMLEAKFGESYLAYRRQVRRWL